MKRRQRLQPGVPVGREHGVTACRIARRFRPARRRPDPCSVWNAMPALGQCRRDGVIAVDARRARSRGWRRHGLARRVPPRARGIASRACAWRTMRPPPCAAEGGGELRHRIADELDPPVVAARQAHPGSRGRTRTRNSTRAARAERVVQRRVVEIAQVAAEPDQRGSCRQRLPSWRGGRGGRRGHGRPGGSNGKGRAQTRPVSVSLSPTPHAFTIGQNRLDP